mmetsp:Transcript_51922/g.93365  ORF Transcript_51922/g.93365 Transcript_51922/m.93365 type:complete len:205 (+) Transcript_51922:63-677(+)
MTDRPVPTHCPCLELSFEITAPHSAGGDLEASPLLEEHVTDEKLREVLAELSQPYSVLRLRVKDKLEKLIGNVPFELDASEVRVSNRGPPQLPPLHTQHKVLNLRDPPQRTTVGFDTKPSEAFTMKGPTPAEAPFMGLNYDFRGTIGYSSSSYATKPLYETHREYHDQPKQNQLVPTDSNPSGDRNPGFRTTRSVNDRTFRLYR